MVYFYAMGTNFVLPTVENLDLHRQEISLRLTRQKKCTYSLFFHVNCEELGNMRLGRQYDTSLSRRDTGTLILHTNRKDRNFFLNSDFTNKTCHPLRHIMSHD